MEVMSTKDSERKRTVFMNNWGFHMMKCEL